MIGMFLAYNPTILAVFLITDLMVINYNTKHRKSKRIDSVLGYRVPRLVSAVEYNPLAFFLIANVATGRI